MSYIDLFTAPVSTFPADHFGENCIKISW